MQIELKISKKMDEVYRSWHGKNESRRIRVPLDLRDMMNIKSYTFLTLKTRHEEIVSFEVWPAYKEDAIKDPMSAYVTREVFDLIKIEGEKTIESEVISPEEGITIGCDPELFLVDKNTGKLLDASRFFKKWQTFGSDGMLLELRPIHSNSEETLTRNLFNLITRGRDEINKNKLILEPKNVGLIGASFYGGIAAGFHIHFGLPLELIFGKEKTTGIIQKIVKALDYYLAIPTMIPEGEEDCARRSTPIIVYGKPGSYRVEPPPPTLEYRVPGGSMLRHPLLTKGMLGLGAVIVEDVVSRIKYHTDDFKNLNNMSKDSDLVELYPNLPGMMEIMQTVCSTNTRKAMYHLDKIVDDVGQMLTFKNRSESVTNFFKILYNGTKFSNDIEKNWRNYYNGQNEQRALESY